MAMPMRFIIVALPISEAKGLKFDLKRVVAYEICELLPSDELLCVARENTSEQSDTILIESRIIILKQLIVNSSIFHKPS
jgi:hypothetical protein